MNLKVFDQSGQQCKWHRARARLVATHMAMDGAYAKRMTAF